MVFCVCVCFFVCVCVCVFFFFFFFFFFCVFFFGFFFFATLHASPNLVCPSAHLSLCTMLTHEQLVCPSVLIDWSEFLSTRVLETLVGRSVLILFISVGVSVRSRFQLFW